MLQDAHPALPNVQGCHGNCRKGAISCVQARLVALCLALRVRGCPLSRSYTRLASLPRCRTRFACSWASLRSWKTGTLRAQAAHCGMSICARGHPPRVVGGLSICPLCAHERVVGGLVHPAWMQHSGQPAVRFCGATALFVRSSVQQHIVRCHPWGAECGT